MSEENNPYSAPEGEIRAQDPELNDLASRWTRLFAFIIDSIISLVITVPFMLYYGVWESAMQGQEMGMEITIMFTLLGVVGFMLFHGYLLKTKGQTIGKYILGIRIVSLDGELPEFGGLIAKRYVPVWLLQVLPALGLLALVNVLLIFRSDKRCIHDLIAGTKVIRIIK